MSATYSALTRSQRQDVRASQRTFEGAYIRTAFGKLSFGLLILRLFAREFLPLGIVFIVSSIMTTALALFQRQTNEKQLITQPSTTYVTGGNIVAITAAIDMGSFIALIVLISKL